MNLLDSLRRHTGCWLAITLLALLMRISGIHAHLDQTGDAVKQSLHGYDIMAPDPDTSAAAIASHDGHTDVCLTTDALVRGIGHIINVITPPWMLSALWAVLLRPPLRRASPRTFEQRRWLPPRRLYWRLPPLRAPPR